MKSLYSSIVLSAFLVLFPLHYARSYAQYDFERWYAGSKAVAVFAQGGAEMRNCCGAGAYAGYYIGDFTAAEVSGALLENRAGVSFRFLWHWWGYEKFDPFFTLGANGFIKGEAGPSFGWGTFWHFNDNWSLRFDSDATLGVEGEDEMVYTLSAGVQYSF